MASEKFANRPEATVAVAYTAGDPTIELDDASPFPTDEDFSIILGNTEGSILKVNGVTGDVFDVEAEEFDGDANVGTSVKIVASKRVAERFLKTPTDPEPFALSGVAGIDDVFPAHKGRRLDQSSWSTINAAGAILQSNGLVRIDHGASGSGGTSLTLRVKAHSAPKTYTMGLLPLFAQAGFIDGLQGAGFVFRESGTGELIIAVASNCRFSSPNDPPAFYTANFASATSATAVLGTETMPPRSTLNPFGLVWLRAIDDNTDITTQFSYDKINWVTMYTASRTAVLSGGPDQIGFAYNNQGGSKQGWSWIVSWEETP